MNGLTLYARYVAISVRGQMQYPGSFLMMSVAQFVGCATEILAIWALFSVFGHLKGWSLGEIAVFYGVVSCSFAIADALTRGFDVFGQEFVRTGAFDRLLLRPRSTALQLLGHEFRLRAGRLVQGAVVLALGAAAIHIVWDPARIALLVWTLGGGVALFVGILILQATLCFWTVEGLEIGNILTYGAVQAAQYPLSIYGAWFRGLMIFVIPLGAVAYFPVLALLGRTDPLGAPAWLLPLTPTLGFVFLGVSLKVWSLGVARYASTGS